VQRSCKPFPRIGCFGVLKPDPAERKSCQIVKDQGLACCANLPGFWL